MAMTGIAFAVSPLSYRPATQHDAIVRVVDEASATHHVKLEDGTSVPLRVELRELAQLPDNSPTWERIKEQAVEAGIAVGIACAMICTLKLFAITFAPMAR